MNYRHVYMLIIEHAKSEEKLGLRKKGNGNYYERHHILPKSLFPLWSCKKSNLVLLTAREHYFCHQLLTKIFTSSEMSYALLAFITRPNADYGITSKEYERIKSNFHPSKESILKRKQTLKGSKWYTNGTKNTLTNNPPEGFYLGRAFSFTKETKDKMSKKAKGRTSNRKGAHLSNETKEVLSKKLKGNKCANPESVRKRHLGMKRWTNGVENKVCLNCPGEGWFRGTTWHTKDTSKMARKPWNKKEKL